MKKLLIIALFVNAILLAGRFWQELPRAQAGDGAGGVATENGDINGDGARNIADPVAMLNWLFGSGPEPVAIAQETGLTPEQDAVLATMRVEGQTLVIEGVNVQILNGQGSTATTNGLGNLIVGYNELGNRRGDDRTGSHNIVSGSMNTYSSYGGVVSAKGNTIRAPYATVAGGHDNVASGLCSSVGGGGGIEEGVGIQGNVASGDYSCVSGGAFNRSTGSQSSVAGGVDNEASGSQASVIGGNENLASGEMATVCGGEDNVASGRESAVCASVNGQALVQNASICCQ